MIRLNLDKFKKETLLLEGVNMYFKKEITDAIDYINDNLESDISIEKVAGAAGFSESHFYKLFTSATGFTVKQYIRNKRLADAARKLVKTDKRIIDIALDASFNSHEVFTRAFYSHYGMTPLEYRKNRKEILLYDRFNRFGEDIKDNFKYIEGDIYIQVRIVEKKEMCFVGMDTKTTIADMIKHNTIRSLWQTAFLPNAHKIQDIVDPYSRIYFEVTNPYTNELYHLACFEVSDLYVPEGMKAKIIPAQKYAVFTPSRVLNALEYSSLITYAYGEWLPISGYQLADDFTFDVSHRENVRNNNICVYQEVYIPIK